MARALTPPTEPQRPASLAEEQRLALDADRRRRRGERTAWPLSYLFRN